jgi:hypothetical protein
LNLDDAALAAVAAELGASPAWYPLSVSVDRVSVIRLGEGDYAAASFLDERLLERGAPARALPLAAVLTAASRLAPRTDYIFHIGHVGSTLISRLIGARAEYFALREPALLRAHYAAGVKPLALRPLLALLARTWRAEQRSIIKLTSFLSEIGAEILAASEAPRALLVYARAPSYLKGIFGGPNSRLESQALAPDRWQRLLRRHPALASVPRPHREGEWIAMSWLSEISALSSLARCSPSQVHWIDFDQFLDAPAPALASTLTALGSPVGAASLEGLVTGPIMRRYSKAPEHAYDAKLRRDVLAGAEQEFPGEIRGGLDWLAAAARAEPTLAALLEARG